MSVSVPGSLARKVAKIMMVLVSSIVACLLILLGALWLSSPGTPPPFKDGYGRSLPRSISEKIYVDINGAKQGMFIRGKDSANPALLYLHGGMPEYFLTQKYPTTLEDYFTVCWWEQRGSGLSYDPACSPDSVTADRLIADALEVTRYLCRRFGQDKIYLMGHSGGSFIGIQAAARAPELYRAYIGMAQISNQLKSERLAYEFMLKRFEKEGNRRMVRKLEAAPVTAFAGIPNSYLPVRDEAMHLLGVGTTHEMKSVLTGIILPSLQFKGYTLSEKINLWRGKFRSGVSSFWIQILNTDLSERVRMLDIPVYFLHGIYDFTVSYSEAKSYFEHIQAPLKGFYTFESSAHSPIFEEPDKFVRILREDVLMGKNDLAGRR